MWINIARRQSSVEHIAIGRRIIMWKFQVAPGIRYYAKRVSYRYATRRLQDEDVHARKLPSARFNLSNDRDCSGTPTHGDSARDDPFFPAVNNALVTYYRGREINFAKARRRENAVTFVRDRDRSRDFSNVYRLRYAHVRVYAVL